MKKWMIAIGILAILGVAGYKYGMDYASEKVIDQVAKQVLTKEEIHDLLNDPAVQKSIQEQAGSEALEQLQQQAGSAAPSSKPKPESSAGASSPAPEATNTPSPSADGDTPKFSTKEEALKFLLGKFSMDELKGFAGQAQGGLTAEEKAAIKSELLSRISPEEFQALKVLGLIELSKQKQ